MTSCQSCVAWLYSVSGRLVVSGMVLMVMQLLYDCVDCGVRDREQLWMRSFKEELLKKMRLSVTPRVSERQILSPKVQRIVDDETIKSNAFWANHVYEYDDVTQNTFQNVLFNSTSVAYSLDGFEFHSSSDLRGSESKVTVGVYLRRHLNTQFDNSSSQLQLYVLQRGERFLLKTKVISMNTSSIGQWHLFDIPSGFTKDWLNTPSSTLSLEVKVGDSKGNRLAVTHPTDPFRPYLAIKSVKSGQVRRRRATDHVCDELSSERSCCRYPLIVDFAEIGWHWVIAPKRFQAWFCTGECRLHSPGTSARSHVIQPALTSSNASCCSPKRLKSIPMLYYDEYSNIVFNVVPSMVVLECGCL